MVDKTIAHYETLDELGAGGMGVVYKAWDTRLERQAAIKALPEELAEDPERLARFEREAKLLASLNNPYIATVYGLEEVEGRRFLAMELVDGESLAERLAKGPIPVKQALELARQIAEALEAAHKAGVIHRDVKPGNIMIDADGRAKVLDFGLAKTLTTEGPGVDSSLSPTLSQPMTQAGQILGTPVYMSPEQVAGQEASEQSDIWAFGCVFYEMLTGKRPVSAATLGDAGVEPNWKALPRATPARARLLLRRCLNTDPRDRLQAIGDARIELAEALSEKEADQPIPGGHATSWAAAAGIAVSAAIASGVLVWGLTRSAPQAPAAPPSRFTIDADLRPRAVSDLAISSDGRMVAFAQSNGQLFIRRLGETRAVPIPGVEGAQSPFFSPDGQWLGYWAEGALRKVPVDGGRAQRIVAAAASYGAVWTEDDRIVFSEHTSPLSIVSANGGERRALTELHDDGVDIGHDSPHLLPGGQGLLFETGGRIALASLETGDWRVLFTGGQRPSYTGGHLVYTDDRRILAVAFDLDSLDLSGEPFLVQQRPVADFKLSSDGTLVSRPLSHGGMSRLGWVDGAGRFEALPFAEARYLHVRLSPDSRRIAATVDEGDRYDIWVLDAARGTRARLTTRGTNNRWPVWTHGGSRIVFTTTRAGSRPYTLFWKPPHGSAPAQLLVASQGVSIPISWSPQHESLAYYEMRGGLADIQVLGPEGVVSEVVATQFDERSPVFSPDGRWLAYVSDESGHDEVYIISYPDLGNRELISSNGGSEPSWSPSGEELYYRAQDVMMVVTIGRGSELTPSTPQPLFRGPFLHSIVGRGNANYAVGPDGRFLMLLGSEPEDRHGLEVALNWGTRLERGKSPP